MITSLKKLTFAVFVVLNVSNAVHAMYCTKEEIASRSDLFVKLELYADFKDNILLPKICVASMHALSGNNFSYYRLKDVIGGVAYIEERNTSSIYRCMIYSNRVVWGDEMLSGERLCGRWNVLVIDPIIFYKLKGKDLSIKIIFSDMSELVKKYNVEKIKIKR